MRERFNSAIAVCSEGVMRGRSFYIDDVVFYLVRHLINLFFRSILSDCIFESCPIKKVYNALLLVF